mmetsp:Transcript_28443/g.53753  ORF Transcript_28443/g.53753 Transcript_28443/m.53753 type:complete len:118 (+) Transcript_28443:202-555(+)
MLDVATQSSESMAQPVIDRAGFDTATTSSVVSSATATEGSTNSDDRTAPVAVARNALLDTSLLSANDVVASRGAALGCRVADGAEKAEADAKSAITEPQTFIIFFGDRCCYCVYLLE